MVTLSHSRRSEDVVQIEEIENRFYWIRHWVKPQPALPRRKQQLVSQKLRDGGPVDE